jgi:hypothetical protein
MLDRIKILSSNFFNVITLLRVGLFAPKLYHIILAGVKDYFKNKFKIIVAFNFNQRIINSVE